MYVCFTVPRHINYNLYSVSYIFRQWWSTELYVGELRGASIIYLIVLCIAFNLYYSGVLLVIVGQVLYR